MSGEEELLEYLDYEVACAKRYRRFLSLVIMKLPIQFDYRPNVLRNTIRESDCFVPLERVENTAAVLMPETDGASAKHAVERYKRETGNDIDMRSGIASFPSDAGSAEDLMESAFRLLFKALESDFGAVVCGDQNTPTAKP